MMSFLCNGPSTIGYSVAIDLDLIHMISHHNTVEDISMYKNSHQTLLWLYFPVQTDESIVAIARLRTDYLDRSILGFLVRRFVHGASSHSHLTVLHEPREKPLLRQAHFKSAC